MNLIKILFSLMSLSIVLVGGLINSIEKYMPVYILQTFRYGKFAYKGATKKNVLKPIEVPKAWFKHFYVFSSILCTFTLWLLIESYTLNHPVPIWLKQIISYVASDHTKSSKVSAAVSLLGLILLTIQCYRRLYDTHFVSVFGAKSRMNLTHYIVGFLHYAGAVFAILAEAPNFSSGDNKIHNLLISDISYKDIVASVLFLWACLHQYKATVILANLRKNPKGKIVSNEHYMPKGDWFEFVSSPHLLAEIIMYLSLSIILWNNSTWWYVLVWVLCNQIETALLSHWWYQETFPKYPKERKVLIPIVF